MTTMRFVSDTDTFLTAQQELQPTYDVTADVNKHGSEGLFDEPAFSEVSKSNPIYASNKHQADDQPNGCTYFTLTPLE